MGFTKKARRAREEREERDSEVWIKKPRMGSTRLRLLTLPDDADAYWEHYEEGVGYYPCNESPDCVGCSSEYERVRERQRQYVYHAIDEKGRLQLYKFGSKLQESLERKQERLSSDPEEEANSILDLDYTIIRAGKQLGTTYEAEPGKVYPLENVPTERYDVDALVEDKYNAAVAIYNGQEAPKPVARLITPGETAQPAKAPAAKKDAAPADEAQSGEPWSAPPAEPASNGNGHTEITLESVAQVPTPELRKFLESKGQELPARVPRSRLVASATALLEKSS